MNRRSVPTSDIDAWIDAGWSYVCPDFDRPNHSIVKWQRTGEPQQPREAAQ